MILKRARKPRAVLDEQYAPKILHAEMSAAALPQAQDLITAICSILYSHSKLELIINAYNQLREGGVLLVGNADLPLSQVLFGLEILADGNKEHLAGQAMLWHFF
jgi:hypothetical protein